MHNPNKIFLLVTKIMLPKCHAVIATPFPVAVCVDTESVN